MATKINLKAVTFLQAVVFTLCSYAQPQPAEYNLKWQNAALLFMENKGQLADDKGKPHPEVLFTARNRGANVFLTSTGIHYQFKKTDYPGGYNRHNVKPGKNVPQLRELGDQVRQSVHSFSVELQGANRQPQVIKEKQSPYTENYYLAHCPAGITGVGGYEKIIYRNVYPAIDWIIYSKEGFMEYDFLVHRGGDPSQIRLKVKDAQSVSITNDGELLMTTSLGEVREKAPVSYAGGHEIASRFIRHADGTIGFAVEAQPGEELRIDPSVIWSTYYGGDGYESGYSCAADGNGNVYLGGETESAAFISSGGFQDTFGGNLDAFLVKFNSTGTRLWATYYGGSGSDEGGYCSLDAGGNVYLGGYTESSSGIASGGFQNTYGGAGDAFLVKFTSAGTRTWATYYGGSGFDLGSLTAVNSTGDIYFAGYTSSAAGIASGGFQNTYGGGAADCFLVKFNSTGGRIWATYYGGSSQEGAGQCVIDASGNVYMGGLTGSATNIASGGFQNTYGGGDFDGFLVKFSSTGSRLWATYYGGSGFDAGYVCGLDGSGNIYMSGTTSSASGIASNGFQNTFGGGERDAYLVKFNSDGARIWSTYYGGIGEDVGFMCFVDGNSNVYLTGYTESPGLASGGIQNTLGGNTDAFVVKFQAGGGRLWATYYGGAGYEDGYGVAGEGNNVYLAGYTDSPSGIASGGFQNTLRGEEDAFLLKMDGGGGVLPVTLTSVRAYQHGDHIQVDWSVQHESSIRAYEVEKSLDGLTFSKAGEVPANNSSAYQWLDKYPRAGNNYYRVRSIGIDGEIKYTPIVKVITGKGRPGFVLYPNPITGNTINVSFINQPRGTYTLRLLNGLAQVIVAQQITRGEGSSVEKIMLNSNLRRGTYTLEIVAPGNKIQTLKLIY